MNIHIVIHQPKFFNDLIQYIEDNELVDNNRFIVIDTQKPEQLDGVFASYKNIVILNEYDSRTVNELVNGAKIIFHDLVKAYLSSN